jgi:hypothetical protein
MSLKSPKGPPNKRGFVWGETVVIFHCIRIPINKADLMPKWSMPIVRGAANTRLHSIRVPRHRRLSYDLI